MYSAFFCIFSVNYNSKRNLILSFFSKNDKRKNVTIRIVSDKFTCSVLRLEKERKKELKWFMGLERHHALLFVAFYSILFNGKARTKVDVPLLLDVHGYGHVGTVSSAKTGLDLLSG